MSARGHDLVQLLARLDDLEIELEKMSVWLDNEGGNSRAAALLDDASTKVGAASRQAMRDREREDALLAAADGHSSG